MSSRRLSEPSLQRVSVVTRLYDYVQLPGLKWVRADELVSVCDLDDDSPTVRIANLRGYRRDTVDRQLTELPALLGHLEALQCLLFIMRRRTGSGEGLAGRVVSLAEDSADFALVDPRGASSGDESSAMDEIVSVEWGTEYLDALADLASS